MSESENSILAKKMLENTDEEWSNEASAQKGIGYALLDIAEAIRKLADAIKK